MSKHVTEKPKTICVECEHHNRTWVVIPHFKGDTLVFPGHWEVGCDAPGVATWNPVTGEPGESPNPSAINDGDCEHFEHVETAQPPEAP